MIDENTLENTLGSLFNNKLKNDFRNSEYCLNLTGLAYKNFICVKGNEIVKSEYPTEIFVIDENNKDVLNQLYFYFTRDNKFNGDLNKGIVFCGGFGTGKTTVVKLITELYKWRANTIISMISTKDFPSIIKSEFENLDCYSKRPLIIDEIGREIESINDFGTKRNPLDELLTKRYDNQSVTFGTSNLKFETMKEKYGKYIEERMLQMFNFIELKGNSRRK